MKKRIIAFLVTIALTAGMVWSIFAYFDFVTGTIFDESTAHLSEIFRQANHTLYNLVSSNWSRMRMWTPYLEKAENDEEIAAYVELAQEQTNFTSFYFISRDGYYSTLSGRSGYLELRTQLSDLILKREPIVANSVVPDQPEIMVFAVPIQPGSYRGFAYEAIAITFNNSDLTEALKISAFNGRASTFASLPDGRIVMDNGTGELESVHNIFALLEKSESLSKQDITALRNRFQTGQSGAILFDLEGRSYYLVYEPANFQNWVVFGVVPSDVVNANMNQLQSTTMLVVGGIAVFLGTILVVMVILQSRQKLKQKDKELLLRDELFKKLSSNVDDIFLLLSDKKLEVEYVSPNVEKLLGLSESAIRENIGCIGKIETGNTPAVDTSHLSQLERGEQTEWEREYVHQKTGEVRLFRVVTFVSEIQGERKYIVDMSDRTNDRKLNQALQTAVQTAENANRAKSAFLSSMSHDIRTPMNAIIGFTTLARNNVNDPEKAAGYLDKIQTSSNHLLGLINDVLDMSRIESGNTVLNLTEEKLSEIVHGLDTVIRPQAAAKKQNLSFVLDGIQHDSVIVDKVRISQICLNLLSNAIKYTPDEGFIRVLIVETSASGNTGYYRIAVEDTGYGMSEEYQKVIFESFTREEDSRTSKIQGTGLGMAITKNLVDLMGGTIRVESKKGKGSRFTVELPLRINQEAKTASQQKERSSSGEEAKSSILKGKHILAAEDNVLNAEILEAILEMEGASCVICENGELALEAFLKSQPGQFDLVLMDIQMPVMNGYDATRAIRQSAHPGAKTIPIIAMTANAFAEDIQNSLDAGMNAHISKPIDLDALEKTVRRVLN